MSLEEVVPLVKVMAVGENPQEVSILVWSVFAFMVALILELPTDAISDWLPAV